MHSSIFTGLGRVSGSGLVFVFVVLLPLGLGNLSFAAGVKWGYSGDIGPEHWGKDFTMCGIGRNQSPIDIIEDRRIDVQVTEQQTAGSKSLSFLQIQPDYQDVPLRIVNNGHTVEIHYDPGSTMTVHGRVRELKQFHFHSPSENHVDGEAFPMEVHLVHADDSNNLTVIGILFKEGETNPFLDKLWAHMPDRIGKEVVVEEEKINVTELLPDDMKYYLYNGSLTTPPCSEGVAWLLLKEPVEASKEQLETFRSAMGFTNNRPIQPINTRVILTW